MTERDWDFAAKVAWDFTSVFVVVEHGELRLTTGNVSVEMAPTRRRNLASAMRSFGILTGKRQGYYKLVNPYKKKT